MTPGTLPLRAEQTAEYVHVASQSPFSPAAPLEGAAADSEPGSCASAGGAYRARVQRARSANRTDGSAAAEEQPERV